jgi:DNA-binding CsgD family transcriptional regulator
LWTNRAFERGLVRQGAVITDTDTATEDEFRASQIYQDLFSTMDVGRFCSGVIFDQSTDGIPATVLTTHRSFSAPPFSPQDRNWLNMLLPHLSRSLGLMYRINSAQLLKNSMLSALDELPLGVMLLNTFGQLMHANTAAQRVLSREDGLTVTTQGQLEALPHCAGQPRLSHWLRTQSSLAAPDVLHFSDAFLAKRTLGEQVYCIQCCPVNHANLWQMQGQSVTCVVFVSNPSALVLPSADRLKGLYGLTPSETKVTHALANGLSNKEAAKVLQTSPDTVRTQVKSIYQKIRVHSQSDLVRTILTLGQASV